MRMSVDNLLGTFHDIESSRVLLRHCSFVVNLRFIELDVTLYPELFVKLNIRVD